MVKPKNNLKNVFYRFHCDDSNAKSPIVVCPIATKKTYVLVFIIGEMVDAPGNLLNIRC
jgi:hypothetical protein